MAACIRDNSWIEDRKLKEELRKYVSQGLRREEILHYMKRDFSKNAWSYRMLDRLLRAFDIYFMDREVRLEQVQAAVQKEIDGPGKLLGYRAMQNKLRQEHNLLVPRDLVHALMFDLDEEGLAARCPVRKKGRAKAHFTTKGTNWVCSLGGHDKLMGYKNSTFPLAVYGVIDTASRRLLWLRAWVTNSNPIIVGRWYLE